MCTKSTEMSQSVPAYHKSQSAAPVDKIIPFTMTIESYVHDVCANKMLGLVNQNGYG